MKELSMRQQKQIIVGNYIVYVYYHGNLTGAKVFDTKKKVQKYASKIENPGAGLYCTIEKSRPCTKRTICFFNRYVASSGHTKRGCRILIMQHPHYIYYNYKSTNIF